MVLFILSACIFIFTSLITKRRYRAIISKLPQNKGVTGLMLSSGLWFIDLIRYRFKTHYDRRMLLMTGQIYGRENALPMLKMYYAKILSQLILSGLCMLLVTSFRRPDPEMMIFCLFVLSGIIGASHYDMVRKLEHKKQSIRMEFPDFLCKFALLVNAGMNTDAAIIKICSKPGEGVFYAELAHAVQDLRTGIPEIRVYEKLADRCGVPEVTRLVSILVQNIKKGNSQLVSVLRLSSDECWQMRLNTAKKLGQEASTRLLIPVMLMFTAILIISAAPAMLVLKGF